ncbi:MAG: DUF4294 domain-containing protein [Saprospiraceae bacterium]
MKTKWASILCFINVITFSVSAQKIRYTYEISKGDTVLVGNFPDVVVREQPFFKTHEEYSTYLKYKRYAEKVFPYAVQAVKAYRELKSETENMGFFERRRYVKEKQHELKSKFEDPLINLTKGQGRMLIKMIERKLQVPMYDVVDDSKGSFTAVYWNVLGKMNGYHLKDGYNIGDDKILDLVIDDYNIPD